jgi:hypothetical protein
VRSVAACLLAWLLSTAAHAAPPLQDPVPSAAPDQPLISQVRIVGASVYTDEELQRRYGLYAGASLPQAAEALAADIRRRYEGDGYTFAEVAARIDERGVLTVEIDEGQIDAIEFHGVNSDVAARLREEFAVQPGDVFNRSQAGRALDAALEVGQGAIERRRSKDTFTLEREGGRRVLLVHLHTRSNRSGLFVGTQGREDWYSPVDGFNPAIGFQSTIFDTSRFNHTYWGGYVTYKFAADRVGYSFGLERPFLRDALLQIGASVQDLTASDDRWRLSPGEQALVAVGFRNTFRDYYRRKGYQVHAAVRPFAHHEWLVAWRDEEQLGVTNETDFGFFRDEHPFRPNAPAVTGDYRAVLLAYTFESRGLVHETPGERYRRHQLDSLFGSMPAEEPGLRAEWISEIAPAALDHQFDFSRHVINVRGRRELSPSQSVGARVMGGFSDGVLPPQRLFALGGIGSVRGYSFKEAAGEGMLLLNAEFRQRIRRSGGLHALAFVDAGRVFDPVGGSTDAWLKGVGVGLEISGARIEFGWRLDDIPSSLQVLFRLGPTF